MNACYALELTSMKTRTRKQLGTEFRCSGLWSSGEDHQRGHKYVNIETLENGPRFTNPTAKQQNKLSFNGSL